MYNINTRTQCAFVAVIPRTREVFGADNFKIVYHAARQRSRTDNVKVFFYQNDKVIGKFNNGIFSRIK